MGSWQVSPSCNEVGRVEPDPTQLLSLGEIQSGDGHVEMEAEMHMGVSASQEQPGATSRGRFSPRAVGGSTTP